LAVLPTSGRVVVQSGTAAPVDSATVVITGDGAETTAWQAIHSASWSTLTTATGTGSGVLRWSRSAVGLAVGVHVDTITVAMTGVVGAPIRVFDTLTVTAAPVPLAVVVTPTVRRVDAIAGSGAVFHDSAEVRLTGDGAQTATWSATARLASTTLDTPSGVASGVLRWHRNSAGLAAGVYVDTLRVVVPGAAGSPFAIVDSLVVSAAPVPLTLALTPVSRHTRIDRGADAGTGTAQVVFGGSGAANVNWAVVNRQSWNSVTTPGGIGSGSLSWRRNTSSLAAGVHVDTLTVSGGGLTALLVDSVEVVEQVTAPTPTVAIALARRGGRARMARMTGQATPSVADSVLIQSISGLSGTGWTASEQSGWLSVISQAGQAPGWVRWTRDIGSLPLGTFVDSIVVTATADPSVRAVYVDTLDVVSVATPEPSVAVRQLFRGGSSLSADQRQVLDAGGNRNGRFDLGDFLAWVRRANIRLSASEMSQVQEVMAEEQRAEVERARERQDDAGGNQSR
jgi:hypothetical protein